MPENLAKMLSLSHTFVVAPQLIFGVIQRYVFWPYAALVVVAFAVAEAYRGHAFDSFKKYGDNAIIWGDMDLSTLDPMTSVQFNEATHYGKQICIVNGCVVDISEFMDRHPGGKRIMRIAAGTDITLELMSKCSVNPASWFNGNGFSGFDVRDTFITGRVNLRSP